MSERRLYEACFLLLETVTGVFVAPFDLSLTVELEMTWEFMEINRIFWHLST